MVNYCRFSVDRDVKKSSKLKFYYGSAFCIFTGAVNRRTYARVPRGDFARRDFFIFSEEARYGGARKVKK